MASGMLHPVTTRHASRSLVARGGIARTFGSLACFIAISFLCVGAYIIADAFANPVAAGAAALLAAAFIIALASIILFYVFKPKRRLGGVRMKRKVRTSSKLEYSPPTISSSVEHDSAVQMERPYHRAYVDHTRIRI